VHFIQKKLLIQLDSLSTLKKVLIHLSRPSALHPEKVSYPIPIQLGSLGTPKKMLIHLSRPSALHPEKLLIQLGSLRTLKKVLIHLNRQPIIDAEMCLTIYIVKSVTKPLLQSIISCSNA